MNPVETLETAKATNPLKDLLKFGQSVWLDYIRRDLMTSGELKRLIDEDGLRGMTSNPSIFEKAIAGSTIYTTISRIACRNATISIAKGVTKCSRFATFRTPPTCCGPCFDASKAAAMDMSAWKFRLSGPRHAGHDRRSTAVVESGGSPECDDQSSGHGRGHSGVPATDRRRHQCQCHAAVRAGDV